MIGVMFDDEFVYVNIVYFDVVVFWFCFFVVVVV